MDTLLSMSQTRTEKVTGVPPKSVGMTHIVYVFVNEWSPWFASLHSHPSPSITAGSHASALPLNTFRSESQAVFYIFKRKKNNRASFHGPSGALSNVPIFLELFFIK